MIAENENLLLIAPTDLSLCGPGYATACVRRSEVTESRSNRTKPLQTSSQHGLYCDSKAMQLTEAVCRRNLAPGARMYQSLFWCSPASPGPKATYRRKSFFWLMAAEGEAVVVKKVWQQSEEQGAVSSHPEPQARGRE